MYHPLPLQSCLALIDHATPCVLLDTACPDFENIRSYLFLDPLQCLTARHPEEVPSLLRHMDTLSERNWMAGYLSYEAASVFEDKPAQTIKPAEKAKTSPCGWFGIFHEPYTFNHKLGRWNRPLPRFKKNRDAIDILPPEPSEVQPSLSAADYARIIQSIKRLIARGHTYQINFTFDVYFKTVTPALDLYRFLRHNQSAPYCAIIKTDRECVLSFSPELFLRKSGGAITVKPMKGTAARGRFFEEDLAIRQALAKDVKNRSENVMIVDLMRNDLGKICQTGSVKVERLFKTQTLKTLHQMTSTITGKLGKFITYDRIFRALFPSGSVTGAPKIRSMEIIRSLEKGLRGVYCGAIGFISPEKEAVFSVPIRTLQKVGSEGTWNYRVGSGIVWDSRASEEWRECSTKCGLLTTAFPKFDIFESLLWDNGFLFAKDHFDRMHKSAAYFFYPFDYNKLISLVETIKKALRGDQPQKVRIFLDKQGAFRWDRSALGGPSFPDPAPAFLSREPIDEQSPFLFNKTTYKPWYEKDCKILSRKKCFDVIHVNSKGKIAEGSRSNIFIRKSRLLYTPPVESGLLPGILRKNLLRRGKCRETVLTPKDLLTADEVYCGNSVRGLVRVKVVGGI
jgi:para-aminobenzoate synthetase / 4-amino-4-deoxychorismate lyase